MSIVTVRRGRRVWTSFLRLTPVTACSARATARAANTTVRWASSASRSWWNTGRARELQAVTGVSLRKLVQTLRPLRTVTIDIDGHTITAKPQLSADAEQILATLPPVAG